MTASERATRLVRLAAKMLLGEEWTRVFGTTRRPDEVAARSVIAFLLHDHTPHGLSFPEIADGMRRANHSSVITYHYRISRASPNAEHDACKRIIGQWNVTYENRRQMPTPIPTPPRVLREAYRAWTHKEEAE